jgi:hypothetical protein
MVYRPKIDAWVCADRRSQAWVSPLRQAASALNEGFFAKLLPKEIDQDFFWLQNEKR